jgi:aminopeptidase YwaD
MKHNIAAFLSLLVIGSTSLCGQTVIPADSLRKHVFILASDSLSGRGFGFPEKQMAVDYIINQFTRAGFKPIDNDYLKTFGYNNGTFYVEGKNIVGIIEGSDPVLKDEYIILGAHYDHLGWREEKGAKVVMNGADDNASGVSSIIEIGKALKDAGLKRTIVIVAFDGEEAGLLGSKAFVSNEVLDPDQIRAMFSFDMVGMLAKNKGLDLNGIKSIQDGKELVKKIADQEQMTINSEKNSITSNTDTWYFAKKDIPAVHVFTGLKSPYHKPGDDADLLDYDGMSSVADFMTTLVTDLANSETINANKHFIHSSVNPRFMIGLQLSLGGSSFHYPKAWFNSKSVFAFDAGIVSKLKLSNNILLQPGILYGTTGSKVEEGTLRMHSITPSLDVLLSSNTDDISAPSSFISLGAYYRNYFSATMDGSSYDFKNDYYSTEKGLRVGFGVHVNKVQIVYQFEFGKDRINKTDVNGKALTGQYSLSLIKFL